MPYNYNGMMNQLYRQRDNIENMIAQYSQGLMNPQAPVQNIINTSSSSDIEEVERMLYEISEGRVLNEERAQVLINNMKPFGMK